MKETNNISTNEVTAVESLPATEKKPSHRKLLITLISVLVALSLLTAAGAVFTFVDFSEDGTTDGTGTTTGTAFDYFTAPLGEYITLTESMVKGLILPGYDSRVDEVNEENVRKYINTILLEAVALKEEEISQKSYSASVKWSEPIDYADDVFLCIAYVEKDGKRVDVPFFENAYMDPGRLQIGMEYFGKEFDDALLGLTPMNAGSYERRTKGEAAADDVVIITYTATETVKAAEEGKEDTVKNHKNVESQRLELGRVEDSAWRDALLAACNKTVGQYFAFDYEEDVNGDGTKEKLKYEGVIDAVVYNETFEEIEATLPGDFFGADPEDETLKALNGAKLKFFINIDHTVPHEANTVDTMTRADIETINTTLTDGGALPFTPSNDKDGKGELSTLTTACETLEKEKNTLQGEIETLKKGTIKSLEDEIAKLEADLAELMADPDADAQDIEELQTKIDNQEARLDKRNEELAGKEEALLKKEGALDEKKAALDAALKTARAECIDFFTNELNDSYAETVKMTAGQLIYEHLVKTLSFAKLPESEIEALEERAKSSVEYYYSQLSVLEQRNYRDIEAFAAVYFGYDEKDYNGYVHYIESYLAPYEIKMQLLLPAIYNTFINDESKLNAKIDAHIADLIALTTAEGEPMTREEILKNYETNAGKDYLRNYYAMPLVVYEFLADNNTVDFTVREIENN